MKTFSETDRHYDRHNDGICSVCGCTIWSPMRSVCDFCRHEAAEEFIKKEELKTQSEYAKDNCWQATERICKVITLLREQDVQVEEKSND